MKRAAVGSRDRESHAGHPCDLVNAHGLDRRRGLTGVAAVLQPDAGPDGRRRSRTVEEDRVAANLVADRSWPADGDAAPQVAADDVAGLPIATDEEMRPLHENAVAAVVADVETADRGTGRRAAEDDAGIAEAADRTACCKRHHIDRRPDREAIGRRARGPAIERDGSGGGDLARVVDREAGQRVQASHSADKVDIPRAAGDGERIATIERAAKPHLGHGQRGRGGQVHGIPELRAAGRQTPSAERRRAERRGGEPKQRRDAADE